MTEKRDLTAERLYELGRPLLAEGLAERGTMMGFPCLRRAGAFFASIDPKSSELVIKLPAARVAELVMAKRGEPFAPNGKVFREWVAISPARTRLWAALLDEAFAFASDR